MQGYKDYNAKSFNDMALNLRKLGYDVCNPIDISVAHPGKTREEYLKKDVAALTGCDSIVVLDNWDKSEGACLEVSIARSVKMPIYKLVDNKLELMNDHGRKFDIGKARWELLPWKEVEEIVKVLNFGALKYEVDNWKRVPNGRERYFGALIRHMVAYENGEQLDPETNLSHLSHAGCCLLFLIWFQNNEEKHN